MHKDTGIIFHPTNRQTLPKPIPFSTKEKIPPKTARFLELYHTIMTQKGLTVYYTIKSSITVMKLRHRVFQFMTANNLWINNKQITDNRPMDAAIIFRGHYKYGNKHVLYVKIMKALKKLEMDKDVTDKQQKVLKELQRHDNYGWTIMNKRHSYTDGQPNHPRIFTDGLIIVVKNPYLRLARELFAMIRCRYPTCLGGGMQILPTGNGDVHGYEGYKAMMIRNNEFHNSTDCITIDGYHPDYCNLVVSFGNHPSQKVYKHLSGIDGV